MPENVNTGSDFNDYTYSTHETDIHLRLKKVLAECRTFMLPAIEVARNGKRLANGWFDNERIIEQPSMEVIRAISIEEPYRGVVPDALVYFGAVMCAIEIRVTNKVNDQKVEKLREIKLPTIEINAKGLDSDILDIDLMALLNTDSNIKYWVYHPKIDEFNENVEKIAKYIPLEVLASSKGKSLRTKGCPHQLGIGVFDGNEYFSSDFIRDCMKCKYCGDAWVHNGESNVLCSGGTGLISTKELIDAELSVIDMFKAPFDAQSLFYFMAYDILVGMDIFDLPAMRVTIPYKNDMIKCGWAEDEIEIMPSQKIDIVKIESAVDENNFLTGIRIISSSISIMVDIVLEFREAKLQVDNDPILKLNLEGLFDYTSREDIERIIIGRDRKTWSQDSSSYYRRLVENTNKYVDKLDIRESLTGVHWVGNCPIKPAIEDADFSVVSSDCRDCEYAMTIDSSDSLKLLCAGRHRITGISDLYNYTGDRYINDRIFDVYKRVLIELRLSKMLYLPALHADVEKKLGIIENTVLRGTYVSSVRRSNEEKYLILADAYWWEFNDIALADSDGVFYFLIRDNRTTIIAFLVLSGEGSLEYRKLEKLGFPMLRLSVKTYNVSPAEMIKNAKRKWVYSEFVNVYTDKLVERCKVLHESKKVIDFKDTWKLEYCPKVCEDNNVRVMRDCIKCPYAVMTWVTLNSQAHVLCNGDESIKLTRST